MNAMSIPSRALTAPVSDDDGETLCDHDLGDFPGTEGLVVLVCALLAGLLAKAFLSKTRVPYTVLLTLFEVFVDEPMRAWAAASKATSLPWADPANAERAAQLDAEMAVQLAQQRLSTEQYESTEYALNRPTSVESRVTRLIARTHCAWKQRRRRSISAVSTHASEP